jgi:type I restriction enzyme R subunit
MLMRAQVINHLEALGWTASAIESSFAFDLQSTLLDLARAIRRLNPGLDEIIVQQALQALIPPVNASLLAANRFVWQALVQGTQLWQGDGVDRQCHTVRYLDFFVLDNNVFTYQVFASHSPFDLVLLVNSLPLVWIKLSTTSKRADIQVVADYGRSALPDSRLFFNHAMLVLSETEAWVGALGASAAQFIAWRVPGGSSGSSLERVLQALCGQSSLLEMLQHFVVFEFSGSWVKKLGRYPQMRAVHECVQRLTTGQSVQARSGVIWHTQGAGKSLSMVFLTRKIRQVLPGYKVVLLTDRRQLADQLYTTFLRSHGERVQVAQSAAALQALLRTDTADLVLGMMQKCRAVSLAALNPSSRIIVLIDEAHRSQYGTLALTLHYWLPNAAKLAFTATPLLLSDKTRQVFGDFIDIYTLREAIADGVTLPLVYIRREVQATLQADTLKQAFQARFEGFSCNTQSKLQQQYVNLPAVLAAPSRVLTICRDLLQHYSSHIHPNGGKAMLVTRSRRAAVIYHTTLRALGAPLATCVISARSGDPASYLSYTNPQKQQQAIAQFRDPAHPLSILIVKDMLLTGFDAPVCQVMYLDKRMQAHGLLQAITRVNRPGPGKQHGYIVDYVGLATELSQALCVYSASENNVIVRQSKDLVSCVRAAHTRLKQSFGDATQQAACRKKLQNPDQKFHFSALFHTFNRYMQAIMPATIARLYWVDWRYWQQMWQSVHTYSLEVWQPALAQQVGSILDTSLQVTVVSKGSVPLCLLADDFSQQVLRAGQTAQERVCKIEQAIKHYIAIHVNQDPAYFNRLSQQLKTILQASAADWDDLQHMLLQLRDTIADNQRYQAETLGLSVCEFAFYGVLVQALQPVADVNSLEMDTQIELAQIAQDIVKMLQKATKIIDFFVKQDELKSIRKQIRRRLMDSTFGRQNERLVRNMTDQCMDLARIKFQPPGR